MKNLTPKQIELFSAFVNAHPDKDSLTRQEMFTFAEETGLNRNSVGALMKKLPRVERGVYSMVTNVVSMPNVPSQPVQQTPVAEAVQKAVGKVRSTSSDEVFIPQKILLLLSGVTSLMFLRSSSLRCFTQCMLPVYLVMVKR